MSLLSRLWNCVRDALPKWRPPQSYDRRLVDREIEAEIRENESRAAFVKAQRDFYRRKHAGDSRY